MGGSEDMFMDGAANNVTMMLEYLKVKQYCGASPHTCAVIDKKITLGLYFYNALFFLPVCTVQHDIAGMKSNQYSAHQCLEGALENSTNSD